MILWIGFIVLIMLVLVFDLGLLNRKAHVIHVREAMAWTALWVSLALAFNVLVYFIYENHWFGIGLNPFDEHSGKQAALKFLTGYIIEESLSMDNIFVIAMIFNFFRVPAYLQHRVLFWGILGAMLMRGAMILAGTALIHRFSWIIYLFGGLLLMSAVKLMITREETIHPDHNILVRLAQKLYPVTRGFDGTKFFSIQEDGKRAITPLFLTLLVVETTDVLFAVDSIPAIFSVTRDPFIVFSSNIFAILGLRSLYFALAGLMEKFQYVKTSLVFVLAFVGIKMILSHHYEIPTTVSLGVICGILAVGILASIFSGSREAAPFHSPLKGSAAQLTFLTFRQAKRILVLIVGSTTVLIGVALIILPGPAFLVIPAGLAILAMEFEWGRRMLHRVREQAGLFVPFLLREKKISTPPSDPSKPENENSKQPEP